MDIIIRPALKGDLPGILTIINYNILNTTAVYDYDIKNIEDVDTWYNDKLNSGWPIIVAEYNDLVVGYATFGTFRFKEGFKYTVEHSVYVSNEYSGKGIGKLLLSELIEIAKQAEYHTMIGCIDASNDGSITFHKKFGFTEQGLLKQSGYKFGKWLDLLFMQLMLKD